MCLVAQLCLTLCDLMDYSPPRSSVHGILQARILEWVAIPFSRGSSQPRDPALQADSLLSDPQGTPRILEWIAYPFSSGSSLVAQLVKNLPAMQETLV